MDIKRLKRNLARAFASGNSDLVIHYRARLVAALMATGAM